MRKKIIVEGMTCMHCLSHVKNALLELGGENLEGNLESKTLVGRFDDEVSNEEIKRVVAEAGYEVVSIE